MFYDLAQIRDLCRELGIDAEAHSPTRIAIRLDSETTLVLENWVAEDDCMLGFDDVPWHTHGSLVFSNQAGYWTELEAPELLRGLADGTVLICELWSNGSLADRWLIHREYADEFRWLEPDDELRVRRAKCTGEEASSAGA